MATDQAPTHSELLIALDSTDWPVVLRAVGVADTRLQRAIVGDPESDELVAKLLPLAHHAKWEVRRAIASVAAHAPHAEFATVLAKLALDDNSRVRQAAEQAAVRRRDSRHASTLGKQHEERITATLDEIEVRFGPKGRQAVKRAAEQIANTYARELYHEVINLLSPLAASAERLRKQLSDSSMSPERLAHEAGRIEGRVSHIRAVLDAMRAYTQQPALSFKAENLREIVTEAVNVVRESDANKSVRVSIEVDVPASISAEVARVRLIQALSNVLLNAVESYEGVAVSKPVIVKAERRGALVILTVEDSGCGMSTEALQDAVTLFATSKPNGTGFGLPLAVAIIESEHGGHVALRSIKDRGTTVTITLPMHRQG